ncbi:MAG: GNAT family N-acetyltransferase, partial [Bacillota bacterium]
MKKNIKICEYEDKYAESLAEMWNKSSENWGGYDHLITTETIIDEHKHIDFINTYLAVDKEKNCVVGYCGFSEYRNDEGALYLPILNVRPDYQGKSIGKALVLKTV